MLLWTISDTLNQQSHFHWRLNRDFWCKINTVKYTVNAAAVLLSRSSSHVRWSFVERERTCRSSSWTDLRDLQHRTSSDLFKCFKHALKVAKLFHTKAWVANVAYLRETWLMWKCGLVVVPTLGPTLRCIVHDRPTTARIKLLTVSES